MEISTANGSITNAYQTTGSNRIPIGSLNSNIECSSNTSSICYLITRGTFSISSHITKYDFSTPTAISYLNGGTLVYKTSVNVLGDDDIIVAGINRNPSIGEHFFFRLNYTAGTYSWSFQMAPYEDAFSSLDRSTMSHLNDGLTKYFSIYRQIKIGSSVIIVLDPANGNLTEVKLIGYPDSSLDNSELAVGGKLSNNQILVTYSSASPSHHYIDIINTDTWELISYSSTYLILYSHTIIFNSDQIILSYGEAYLSDLFSLQTAYDKLHLTEVYNLSTHNLTDITSNYTKETYTDTLTTGSETAQTITVTVNNATLTSDSDKSYKVNVNIFSDSMETYNGTVNDTTSFGPLQFDCYDVVTAATNTNFTNQLTFATKDGSSMVSWISFDSTAGNVSISIPSETSSDNFTITNTYTGVLGNNFTLATDLTINIVEAQVVTNNSNTNTNTNNNEDDDDH